MRQACHHSDRAVPIWTPVSQRIEQRFPKAMALGVDPFDLDSLTGEDALRPADRIEPRVASSPSPVGEYEASMVVCGTAAGHSDHAWLPTHRSQVDRGTAGEHQWLVKSPSSWTFRSASTLRPCWDALWPTNVCPSGSRTCAHPTPPARCYLGPCGLLTSRLQTVRTSCSRAWRRARPRGLSPLGAVPLAGNHIVTRLTRDASAFSRAFD